MRLPILALLLALALPSAAAPQGLRWRTWRPAEGQLQKRVFRLAEMRGDPRDTIYFLPTLRKPGERPPLVVALPGGRGVAEELVAGQPQLFAQAERLGFVVLVPSSTMAYSSVLPSGVALQDLHDAYVLRAIAEAEERFGTDPERKFLIGFSAGGAGVWALALRHPAAFRGLALIAPAGSPERDELAPVSHLPVYMVQAADDHAIRRWENRRAARDLQELGAAIRFTEPAHGSHGLQEYPVIREAYEWFRRLADEKR